MDVMNFHSSSLTQQCLVCAADSLTNYVDLTLVTSQTTQSETPVEDKLKIILNDNWREPESDMGLIICLPCFHMVDQLDELEIQIQNLKKNITEKYVTSYGRDKLPPPEKAVKHRKRRGRPPKSAAASTTTTKATPKAKPKPKPNNKPKRTYTKRKKVIVEDSDHDDDKDDDDDDDDENADLTWTVDDAGDGDSNAAGPSQKLSAAKPSNENGTKARKEPKPRAPPVATRSSSEDEDDRVNNEMHTNHQPEEPKEEENKNVYDDDPALLNQGERLRMGHMVPMEGGNITYNCAYCIEAFPDIGMLKAHVRVRHRPELLTTLLPAELGLGSKVNCGMQLENVTSTTEQGRPFVCIFCDGAFKFKSNVLLHYKEKHTPHKPFSCVDCKESFRRSMELSRHRVYYCPFRKRKVPRKPGREAKNIKKE